MLQDSSIWALVPVLSVVAVCLRFAVVRLSWQLGLLSSVCLVTATAVALVAGLVSWPLAAIVLTAWGFGHFGAWLGLMRASAPPRVAVDPGVAAEPGSAPEPNALAVDPGAGMVEGSTLGRYVLDRQIGRGAMGAVYLGRDPKIGRQVAIKTLALSQLFSGAELAEARTERLVVMATDALQMRTIEDRIGRLEAELTLLQKRIEALAMRAETAGQIAIPRTNDLGGRFLKKGDQIGQIVTGDDTVIRVAVVNHEANRVRNRTEDIELRWPNAKRDAAKANLLGEVPATVNALPSAALGERGGGRIQIDPQASDGMKTQEPVFLFDIQTRRDPEAFPGMRVWVRFDHGSESIVNLLHREWRRAFLRHFEK